MSITNSQKYKDGIISIIKGESPNTSREDLCEKFIQNHVLKPYGLKCEGLDCVSCMLLQRFWLDEEYKELEEPGVDWTQVAVDTPILVRNSDDSDWTKRYFATYDGNFVYSWRAGTTSWTADGIRSAWNFAKLAEEGR